jgi:hypothetical protein
MPMKTRMADFVRLTLLIQRLLDADVFDETEGGPLLAETEAVRHALEGGDWEAARGHLEQVTRLTAALIQTDALALAPGREVLQTANRILNPETDTSTGPC